MKVKQKLKTEPGEGADGTSQNVEIKKEVEDLTPEDEERRRRRRERNKVAATKCRNKKKEKTHILVAESEIVEVQNASLKAEVARLDAEKRRLTNILALHEPNCAKRRRMCSGSEESGRSQEGGEDCFDLSQTFRRPAVPGGGPSTAMGGDRVFAGLQQDEGYSSSYSTNRSGGRDEDEEEDEETSIARLEVFKTEPKEYNKYSNSGGPGEMYDVYKYSAPEYSPSRNLTYPGGYYDHMCLAL